MDDSVNRWTGSIATWLERMLALVILVAALVFAWRSTSDLAALDWGSADTFYDAIHRVLLLVIGVELARTLVTHDVTTILELLAFIIARKMLKPDLSAFDILLSTAGFVALMAARRYLAPPKVPAAPSRSGGSGQEKV